MAYDALMRLPIVIYGTILGGLSVLGLAQFLGTTHPALPSAAYGIDIAMRVSNIAFFALLAIVTVSRGPAREKAGGVEPRISALVGTFLVYAIALFPHRDLSAGGEFAATTLMLIGTTLAAYILTELGRSFSVMAEARALVTSGIYRVVRHPLYLAEEIAVLGLAVQYRSYWTLLLVAVHAGFQLRRIHNEEAVLIKVFPEYRAYGERTARLIPGVY